MTPISALAILFCIYAVSELIAQKTKAIFSTVLSIAILLLAGFWSGILPRTLIDDAQITGFGNIIAGLLIVSLGTTIDFAELRRQWKVVITALCGFPSTDYAAHTIMHHLEDYGTIRFQMGYACAIATVLFVMMVGVNLLVQKLIAKVGE